MADEIRVDYEQLRQAALRFAQRADANQQTTQLLQRKTNQLQNGWLGSGSQAFFAEMSGTVLPAMTRLTEALRRAHDDTLKMSEIFARAEEDAARPFRDLTKPGLPAFLDKAGSLLDLFEGARDWGAVAAAVMLAFGMRTGTSYAGQIIVQAPGLLTHLGIPSKWLKDLAGVSENLTHIKATNMVSHVSRWATPAIFAIDTAISLGQGVVAVSEVWNTHAAEYAAISDATERFSAKTVDAGMAALPVAGDFLGGWGGALAGAKLGALAGSFVAPGLGTAIGAVVGGALGGLLGSKAGEAAATAGVDALNEHVGRENAIGWFDQNFAQPVADDIAAVEQTVGGWFNPSAQPVGQPVAP